MDCLDRASGKFRDFRKDDFESDWIKVAESRFSQVHRVRLKTWREQCALKCISVTSSNRMRDEALEIAKVKSRFIVSIYGLCSDPNTLVMEYLSNGSLDNLLTSHTLMWTKKFGMIHEVTMGMDFLHNMKPPLIHFNLKTSNVLLDENLHAKISDFGLIKWEEGSDKNRFLEQLTARGNISYIPPETFTQCADSPGAPFDVYSFAIVIWEIMTQQKPYPGSSVTNVLIQVSNGKRPSMGNIPQHNPPDCEHMVSIMKQCWHQDHRKRPAFSDIVRKTEVLSEVLKIPGVMQETAMEDHRQRHAQIFPPAQEMFLLERDVPSDSDNILSLLSKKDFVRFINSVNREDTALRFSDNNSLLHYTVASGDEQSILHVLSLGANVNCQSARGYTPLIVAVIHRIHDVITLLLRHGACVTQGDEDQWTPIHFAAQSGDDRTLRTLLDHGGLASAQEKTGWTPLHLACQNGHEAAARLLLSRLAEGGGGGGDVGGVGAREEAEGRTPLHLACSYGHFHIAKLLLSQGAEPDATDSSGCTALHLASARGHNRVVRKLLKCGAHGDGGVAGGEGYTPLHMAALSGNTGICRQLVAGGASPDPRTARGWTPIHLASARGHAATVLQLESQGGNVNASGESRWTALHLACHHGHAEVAAGLLEAHADPNVAEGSGGWTPLHLACRGGSVAAVERLVAHGAHVNEVNWAGATPLHLAARHGWVSIVEALLTNGADGALRDVSGSTPLDVAHRAGRKAVNKALLKPW